MKNDRMLRLSFRTMILPRLVVVTATEKMGGLLRNPYPKAVLSKLGAVGCKF